MRTLLTILYFAFFLSIFSIPASVWSQPRLEAEIDQIVTVLVEQINREEGVKTIAIADFTDLGYQPNLLGKQLAEEFLSAFVRARDKNFRMISRSMYEALRAEQALEGAGKITPDNLPQYGVLEGIDLVLGGTLSPRTNTIRLNLRGIELETGSLVSAYSGNITLTPSLQKLIEIAPAVSQDVITGEIESHETGDDSAEEGAARGAPQMTSLARFQKGSLLIEAQGCRYNGSEVICQFLVRSEGSDEIMSLYGFSSQAAFSDDRDLLVRPTQLQFGEQKSNRRITGTLLANGEEELLVYLQPNTTSVRSIASLTIKCHTNSEGIFDITFENISIQR